MEKNTNIMWNYGGILGTLSIQIRVSKIPITIIIKYGNSCNYYVG